MPLIFTTPYRNAVHQHVFSVHSWYPALRAAGLEPGRTSGVHALRHFYASALLDAGESIRAVAEWLGHANPAFTLRVHAHLMPESSGRARHAIDSLLGRSGRDDGPATAREGR